MVVSMLMALPAFATTTPVATTTNATITQMQSLLSQIKILQEQIEALNKQKGQLRSEIAHTLKLTKDLRKGMTSEEVKLLQEILAADPDIYPEGITSGYFGDLTEKAVRKFQKKYGIEQLGLVGPRTRDHLHKILGSFSSTTPKLPPGLAKKLWNNASSTATTTNNAEWKLSVCHKNKETLVIAFPAVQAHLAHGDRMGACSVITQPATTTATSTNTNANATSTTATTTNTN